MRIRTIKPEFWASESMGRLDRDTRLVFIGLWSLADDHGRFRADPRYIAGQLFPYDSDGQKLASRALASLREESCIALFEVDRSQYGVITGWKTHQKIDRPSASRIPQPPEISLANIREPSMQAREGSCEDQGSGIREGNREQGDVAKARDTAIEALREIWNDARGPDLPEWQETGTKRRKAALARLRERPLDEWRPVIARVAASRFCCGVNDRGWRADPEWLLKPETATKVLEGKYDNRKQASDHRAPVSAESQDWTNAEIGELQL